MPDAQNLMGQAMMTAQKYMYHAAIDIDQQFGDGYAKAHPELVAAYMQTTASDFAATFGLQSIADNLALIAARMK